ncbi:MAG: hypothetical protein RLP14_08370 [Owenweeksia sp.]
MKFIQFKYLLFILIIGGCNDHKYISGYSGMSRIALVSSGSPNDFVTYVLDENNRLSFAKGPACYYWDEGKVKATGFYESIVIPDQFNTINLSKKDAVRHVKAGEWFYYDGDGMLDSIIDYKSVRRFFWTIDTVPMDDKYIAIDSILNVEYKKRVIYVR